MFSLKSELVGSSDGERRFCLVKRLKKVVSAAKKSLDSVFFSMIKLWSFIREPLSIGSAIFWSASRSFIRVLIFCSQDLNFCNWVEVALSKVAEQSIKKFLSSGFWFIFISNLVLSLLLQGKSVEMNVSFVWFFSAILVRRYFSCSSLAFKKPLTIFWIYSTNFFLNSAGDEEFLSIHEIFSGVSSLLISA